MANSVKRVATPISIIVVCVILWLALNTKTNQQRNPDQSNTLSPSAGKTDYARLMPVARKTLAPRLEQAHKQGPGVLRVKVCDSDGLPAPQATVCLRYTGIANLTDNPESSLDEITRDSGIVTFSGLKLGEAFLSAKREELRSEQHLILLTERAYCQEVVLMLHRTGRVIGKVVDQSALPIVGARVVVCEKDDTNIIAASDSPEVQYTGLDGRFEFEQLPEGLYRFRAFANSYAPGESDRILANTTEEAVIRLNHGVRVSGFVKDALSRSPTSGFTLVLQRRDAHDKSKTVVTDDRGHFEFDGLAQGAYTLQSGDDMRILSTGAVDIDVSNDVPQKALELLVQEGVEVHGRVLLAGSEAPVTGVKIGTTHAQGNAPPRYFEPTNEAGQFVLKGVAVGTNYFVIESHDAYLSARMPLNIPSMPIAEGVDIHVSPATLVEGIVVDGDDLPVPGVAVTVTAWTPGVSQEGGGKGTTDSGGRFSISCLYCSVGNTVMILASSKLANKSEPAGPFTMTEDGLHSIVVRLSDQPTGSVSGRVVNQNGEPVFAFVSARPANEQNTFSADELEAWRASPDRWRSGGSARTDVNGHFVILNLQEGDYDLFVAEHNREGYQTARQIAGHVSLNAGQRLTGIELLLDAGAGDITGLVTDEQGRPIAGAYVIAHPNDDIRSDALNCMSNRSGAYRMANLPEGTYLLRVNYGGYHCRPERGVSPGQEVNFVLVPNEGTAN